LGINYQPINARRQRRHGYGPLVDQSEAGK